jgi:primosomal protein N' (replication factor Y)
MRIVSVALPLPIRRNFSYGVPEALAMPRPGARVRVPFGERALTGIVLPEEGEESPGLREVLEVLDPEPVCPPELLDAAEKLAKRSFASVGEVLRSALPARLPAAGAIRYRITERGALARAPGAQGEILDRLREGAAVRLSDLPVAGRQEALRGLDERGLVRAVSAARDPKPRSEKAYMPAAGKAEELAALLKGSRRGRDVVGFLEALGRPAVGAEITLSTGAGPAVLRNLLARGALRSFDQARKPDQPAPPAARAAFRLTGEQEIALAEIREAIAERRYFPALLQGVTGSGKTEVYLRAIAAALEAGRGAIWLVPEIAMTPVFARELQRQFGEQAALLHSSQSERERAEAWDRVRSGKARAVIGPRSAAFAPVADPGLFVVDEEHDGSYKQRESPSYDARDIAKIRARTADATIVLGITTPSMGLPGFPRRPAAPPSADGPRGRPAPAARHPRGSQTRSRRGPEEERAFRSSLGRSSSKAQGRFSRGTGDPAPAAPRLRPVSPLPAVRQ